jgi:hypothetical protein
MCYGEQNIIENIDYFIYIYLLDMNITYHKSKIYTVYKFLEIKYRY